MPNKFLAGPLAELRQRLPLYILAGASFLLFGRLCIFVWENSVNILFGDEWDFYTPLFNRDSWWTTFRWQHASPRLGLGAIVSRGIAEHTRWDSQVEALAAVSLVFLATCLALLLKKQLFGRWSLFDVIIPAVLLSRSFFEIYISLSHPSLGGLPLILIFLYCLSWIQRNATLRYAFVLVINFFAIYTGYAMFIGLLTPLLFLRELLQSKRSSDRQLPNWALVGLAVSIASWLSFFVGYQVEPRAHFNLLHYLRFIALMLANFFGLKPVNALVILIGIAILVTLVLVVAKHAWKLMRTEQSNQHTSLVITILLAYSLLFAVAAAVARSGLDARAAQASRYLPFIACAFIALYFHLLTISRLQLRRFLVTAYVVLLVANYLHFSRVDRDTVYSLREGKRQWRECYLRAESIDRCDHEATFAIHSNPIATRLKQKLDYLKEHRLNLYAASSEP